MLVRPALALLLVLVAPRARPGATPAIVTTSPTTTIALGRSPVAMPTITGSATPVAEIGATTHIVPIASAR